MSRLSIRRVLQLFCVIIVVACAAALVLIGYRYVRAASITTQAQQEFLREPAQPEPNQPQAAEQKPTQEEAPASVPQIPPEVDFDALEAKSANATSWLWIGGTNISYPIVRGKNNDKYLSTAYDGTHSVAGSIFMDYRNEKDFSDDNTILYGHNMKDRSMFGSLKLFRDQIYAEQHELIHVMTREGVLKYRVFAVYDIPATSDCYTRSFGSDEARKAAVEKAARHSAINMGISAEQVERYLTLSTCTASDEYRLVVQAYLVQ